MSIEDIFYYEMQGIINTINNFTRDSFILNYTNLLSKSCYPEDKEKIKILSKKLLDWYTEQLDLIKENNYLSNKNAHFKSVNLLKELYTQSK